MQPAPNCPYPLHRRPVWTGSTSITRWADQTLGLRGSECPSAAAVAAGRMCQQQQLHVPSQLLASLCFAATQPIGFPAIALQLAMEVLFNGAAWEQQLQRLR